jgi:hypothetical protein
MPLVIGIYETDGSEQEQEAILPYPDPQNIVSGMPETK